MQYFIRWLSAMFYHVTQVMQRNVLSQWLDRVRYIDQAAYYLGVALGRLKLLDKEQRIKTVVDSSSLPRNCFKFRAPCAFTGIPKIKTIESENKIVV